ncbi:MAG: PAS domain S-box protein [Trueperaceae bacterium]
MNLRLRLALIYGLLASLALTFSLVAGFGFYERAAFRNIDGVLELLTQQTAVVLERTGKLEPPNISIPTAARLFTSDGNLLENVSDDAAPKVEPLQTLETGVPAYAPWIKVLPSVGLTTVNYQGLGLERVNGVRWRSFTMRLADARLLQLIVPLERTDAALQSVQRNFFILGLLGAVLVFCLGYALSGTSLRPLTELATNTKELLHAQNISLPATIAGQERQSVESQGRIPSHDDLGFLSRTITSTTASLSGERERLDLALEAAKMGWWEWDIVANVHRWSAEFERLLGLEPGTFQGGAEAFLERVHPADRAFVSGITNAKENRPGVFEYRILVSSMAQENPATINSANAVRWLESRAQILRDATGRVVRVLGIDIDITERKRAELELRESEERFRAVQQTTPDGFMIFESVYNEKGIITDFRWLYANPASGALVGRNPETLIGKHLLVEMPGNRDEGLFDAYVRIVVTGEPWQREFSYRYEGINKWFRSTAAKTGNGFAVSFVDISESKTFEQNVRDSEARYRSLVQASTQLVWSTDAAGFNTEPQESWLAFTGQSWDDEKEWGWLNAIHDGDRERIKTSWSRAITNKTIYLERERLRRHDGIYRQMDVRAVPVFNDDGSVREWIGTHTDVTERVNAAAALAESEERYRSLVVAANQAIFTADETGRSFGAEEVWQKLTGQTPEVAKDDGWLEGIHPKDRARVAESWRVALQKREAFNLQYQSNAKGNQRRHIATRAVPRFSSSGEFLEWTGTISDITERKNLELDNEFLGDISESLRNADDAKDLLAIISQRLCEYLELPDCFFAELDKTNERYKLHAGFSNDKPFMVREEPLYLYNPVLLEDGEAKRVTVAYHVATDERLASWYEKQFKPSNIEAFIHIPFLRQGHLVGSFTIASDTPYTWSERELNLVKTIAERTWLTLEKLRVDQELERQEERYRSLIEASSTIVWTTDALGNVIHELPQWGAFTGQTFADYKQSGWSDAIHPHDKEITLQTWQKALTEKSLYAIEHRVRRADGAYVWFSVRSAPVFADTGDIREWIGTHTDISERKATEQLLASQAKTLREQADLLALANEALIIRDANDVITAWNEAATELYGYEEIEVIGRVSNDILQTRFLNTSRDTATTTLLEESYWDGELQHTRKDGEKITVLSRQALRRDDHGKALEIIEINWDITSRKQVEIEREKLLELSQRAEREALALAEIASSFSLSKGFETNLTMIAQRVAQTVGADACAVEIYTSGNTDLGLTGAYGYPVGFGEALHDIRANKIETLSQRAIRLNEVVVVKDFVKTLRVNKYYNAALPLIEKESWGTAVAVPMPVTKYAGGAVVVYYPKGLDPNLTDLLQLSTIVSQIALVVENARLFEEAQGKAALEERQRLARDLHDSVSQALYGISLGANSAKNALSLNSSEAKLKEFERSLKYLIYMADTAMAEMKSLIFELRPESLETEGLVIALRKHLRALELRHRFGLELNLQSEPSVSLKVKEMLYRITQEAMNNIVKHAQAKHVWISLCLEEKALRLEVRDDGVGFNTQQEFPGHIGLHSMRERAESVGASYEILSAPNEGTTVRVILPLET